MKNELNNNKGSIYLFQYVLDDNAAIVKDELYEYFIIRALYEHAKDSSILKKDIKVKIEEAYHLDEIPIVHFDSALERVKKKKKVIGEDKFSLSADTRIEINQNIQNYIDLMTTVQNELKQKISENMPELTQEKIKTISENFFKLLGKTFALHGKDIARIVINQSSNLKNLENHEGFKSDYQELILKIIPTEQRTKMDSFLNDFLFNPSENQSKFIFKMVQGHTLLEILNVDPELQHIQEEALKETKLYLDTNVIINLLFKNGRYYETLKNVVEQSQNLGVTFVINEITQREFEHWLETHKKEAEQIRNSPQEYVDVLFHKKIDAPLLMGYLDSLRQNPRQTIDQFCAGFEDISKNLKHDFGIEYDENSISQFKQNKIFNKLFNSVYRANETKPPFTVKHDAISILKVKELRKKTPSGPLGPKIWFLTTDSTLWKAERKIFSKNDIRASVTANVWFQIISPLISPKLKTQNVTRAFSKLLSTNFGMDSIIKQEDVLNISAAFIDTKGLKPEDYDGLLGDKRVRNTLKKLHQSQSTENKDEQEKWSRESLNIISKKLKNKTENEIEKALSQFSQTIKKQNKEIDKQSKEITEQGKTISELKNTLEKKWTKNYLILLFVSIGIGIIIPIVLLFSNLGLSIDNILGIVTIEAACIIGIFVPWKLKHG